MKEWHQIVSLISPSVVKIETPDGHGTGFLCAYNADKTLVGIATAHHVVDHADKWQQPIRIHNLVKDTTILLQEADRVIIPDPLKDSAVIIIFSEARIKTLDLPEEPIGFIAPGKHSITGVEVGWLGYPSIGPDILCFFSGIISAWQASSTSYLIDGVAINGVSGGPVFRRYPNDDAPPRIIGSITAYMPNRLTSGTLPGLSIAQDVTHFQKVMELPRLSGRRRACG